jgi:hypothetical protein
MKRLIPLSTIEYFTQGNTMIGSVTPEELVADPLAELFHYRVFADGEKLTALYFIDNRCYDLTDKSKVAQNDFELSPDGIDAAAAWLEAQYHAYARTIEY